jgi:hypothetical protein
MTELEELIQVINRIGMLSQVPAASLERSAPSTDDEIGGRRPKGGIIAKDDFEPDFALRSAEYFRRRLMRNSSPRAVTVLLAQARATLEAWRRMPVPKGQPPALGDPQWKRWVAESDLDTGELARKFSVSRQYIQRVRKAYREAA